MARYGRDFERDAWGMRGEEGSGFYGGGDRYGSHWRGSQGGRGGEYGGMGADAQDYPGWERGYRGGESEFGSGGGAYDNDFSNGWSGNQGSWGTGGLTRGYGGEFYSGASYGYDTGRGGQGWGGRDEAGSGGMGGDWGARDTGLGGGRSHRRGGGGGRGQDETRSLRAVDIMTENPECVTPETSLADAARKMRDLNVGIIPVVESEQGRRLRGVVTDRDLAIRAVADAMDARTTRVSEVMTTEVEACNKNDSVSDILRVMQREQVRRVPITDREGRLVGIVAQADVVRDVDGTRGEHRVNDTIERISEPTRGSRGGGMRMSQSRGMSQGGEMGASHSRPGGGTSGGWSGAADEQGGASRGESPGEGEMP